jgi:hypothetical protein
VRDDGSGFAEHPASAGMGLRTMRYRSQCIGASLVIESHPGAGTAVSCRVPKGADPNGIKIRRFWDEIALLDASPRPHRPKFKPEQEAPGLSEESAIRN